MPLEHSKASPEPKSPRRLIPTASQPKAKDLNRWLTERRNVYQDYRKVFGQDPENPQAVVVSIDTNDTHSKAEAFIGRIIFTNGFGEAALNR